MSRTELMAALGLKASNHFARAYLQPSLAAGVIEMTLPDRPRSKYQKYRRTEHEIQSAPTAAPSQADTTQS